MTISNGSPSYFFCAFATSGFTFVGATEPTIFNPATNGSVNLTPNQTPNSAESVNARQTRSQRRAQHNLLLNAISTHATSWLHNIKPATIWLLLVFTLIHNQPEHIWSRIMPHHVQIELPFDKFIAIQIRHQDRLAPIMRTR